MTFLRNILGNYLLSIDALNLAIASITNIGAIYLIVVMLHWVKRLRYSKTDLRPLVFSLALAKFAVWFWTFLNIIGLVFFQENTPAITLPARFLFMVVVILQIRVTAKIGPAPRPNMELKEELCYDGRMILIVDDNEPLARIYRRTLEVAGFNAEFAVSAEDALVIMGIEQPSMMIVDIGLPGMDGVELCIKAKQMGFTGPVVAISGIGQHRLELSGACFSEFIVKPITGSDLVALVRRALSKGK